MMLNELINKLKVKLLQDHFLGILCYFYINGMENKIAELDKSDFTGEVEQIAVKSFLNEYAETNELELIEKGLSNNRYRALNIYHFIGLSLQDKLSNTHKFDTYLKNKFDKHSFKYKYLITKFFDGFENDLKTKLKAEVDTNDYFILILKTLYLEAPINKSRTISHFEKEFENLDIIDLLLLEDLLNIGTTGYNKLHE